MKRAHCKIGAFTFGQPCGTGGTKAGTEKLVEKHHSTLVQLESSRSRDLAPGGCRRCVDRRMYRQEFPWRMALGCIVGKPKGERCLGYGNSPLHRVLNNLLQSTIPATIVSTD